MFRNIISPMNAAARIAIRIICHHERYIENIPSAARTIRKSIAESGDDLKVSTMKFVTPSASHRVETKNSAVSLFLAIRQRDSVKRIISELYKNSIGCSVMNPSAAISERRPSASISRSMNSERTIKSAAAYPSGAVERR